MPFARPSLSDLVARVRADLHSRLSTQGPLLRRAVASVCAPVWAGAVHMLHGHLDWIAKQIFPDTSDEEMLLRQAATYGITPAPAEYAGGPVKVTGVTGAVVEAGEILVYPNGLRYVVQAEVTLVDDEGIITVTAEAPGSSSNLEEDEVLAFESPITDVDSDATVHVGGITGGLDQGTVESVRVRLLQRLREPPQGGADHDYVAWALSVAGVTRAWVFPNENGLGTVVVRFVLDTEDGVTFPDGAAVADVQEVLDAERPITAIATAEAPVELATPFDISVTPNTTPVKDAVTAELNDLFFRDGAPGDGAGQGTILYSKMLTAIGVAAGLTDFTLNSPTADVVPGLGELATVGTITWS